MGIENGIRMYSSRNLLKSSSACCRSPLTAFPHRVHRGVALICFDVGKTELLSIGIVSVSDLLALMLTLKTLNNDTPHH